MAVKAIFKANQVMSPYCLPPPPSPPLLVNYKHQSLLMWLRIKPKLLPQPTWSSLCWALPTPWPHVFCSSVPYCCQAWDLLTGLSSDLSCSGRPALTSHANPSPSIPSHFPLSVALTLFLPCWLCSVLLPLLEEKLHKGKDLVLLIHQDIPGTWTTVTTW